MRKIITCFVLLLSYSCQVQQGNNVLWQPIVPKKKSKEAQLELPLKFKSYQLKENTFSKILENTGNTPETGKLIIVPNPKGAMQEFNVWKSKTVDPKLLVKYPNLQAYQGVSTSTTTSKIRLEKSKSGYEFMVIKTSETWFGTSINTSHYLFYFKKDLPKGSKSYWKNKTNH